MHPAHDKMESLDRVITTLMMMIPPVMKLLIPLPQLLLVKPDAKGVKGQPQTTKPAHLYANDAWVIQLLALA